MEAVIYRGSKLARPACWLLLGPDSVLHFRLTELEEFQPLFYKEDPQRMADLITYFSTYYPNGADVQALLNILLTASERGLVLYRAKEEAQRLHQENPDRTPKPAEANPLTEPNWNPSGGGKPSTGTL